MDPLRDYEAESIAIFTASVYDRDIIETTRPTMDVLLSERPYSVKADIGEAWRGGIT